MPAVAGLRPGVELLDVEQVLRTDTGSISGRSLVSVAAASVSTGLRTFEPGSAVIADVALAVERNGEPPQTRHAVIMDSSTPVVTGQTRCIAVLDEAATY